MKRKKWFILVPILALPLIVVILYSRISYKELYDLEKFELIYGLDDIDQAISTQPDLSNYISLPINDVNTLHDQVVLQIKDTYQESSFQHRMIYYYFDSATNRYYFYSKGALIFHSDIYGYYDYDEGHIRMIHGMF